MKGIYIFEEAFLKDAVACLKLSNIEHKFKCEFGKTITEEVDLHALVENLGAKTRCNKEDTYDFETGALIALMKMCGVEKVTKACDELYKDDNYKNALQEMTENNEKLIEENIKLRDEIVDLDYRKTCNETTIELLYNTINTLSSIDDKYKELKEENEKLKLDCEKLQHGYIDTDMIFCGGRQNGKQYTFLVDLFKKLDQNKVDEAYKEAYNTKLPVWQKEIFKQMCNIYEESKEKPELPRTLDINGTVYRKSIQIKDFGEQINKLTVDSLIEENRAFTRKCVDEWLYRIPTKREEMWAEIFALHKESDVIIKVKKEDVNTFLHEIEKRIPEITWASGGKIFESKSTIGDIYESLKTCDKFYFRLHKRNKLTYSNDSHIYPYREFKPIDYLPPMRWDLFKKGRIAVKVTYNNYKEFCEACEKELGKKPSTYLWDNVTISISKKDGNFEIFTIEHQKKTGRKIVDWEDVR